jgi:hypothetical protein
VPGSRLLYCLHYIEVRYTGRSGELRLQCYQCAFTGFDELPATGIKPIEPESEPCTEESNADGRAGMFFKKRCVSSDEESCRYKKEVEGLHSLSGVKREPIPGVFSRLVGYVVRIGRRHWLSLYGSQEIPWPKVVGIGNVLRHEHKHVAHDVLWHVVRDDLPPLERVAGRNWQRLNLGSRFRSFASGFMSRFNFSSLERARLPTIFDGGHFGREPQGGQG